MTKPTVHSSAAFYHCNVQDAHCARTYAFEKAANKLARQILNQVKNEPLIVQAAFHERNLLDGQYNYCIVDVATIPWKVWVAENVHVKPQDPFSVRDPLPAFYSFDIPLTENYGSFHFVPNFIYIK